MTAATWNDWNVGDRVRLRHWEPFAPDGTIGTVVTVYPEVELLEVRFDGSQKTRWMLTIEVERVREA